MTMMRQPTEACELFIKGKESFVSIVKNDPVGIPTGGWGHTRNVTLGEKVSVAKGQAWFEEDLREAIATIYRNLSETLIDSLPQLCYDALVSFVFNVGAKAFRDPKTGKRTDFYNTITKDLSAIGAQIKRWTHAVKDGKLIELPGLVTRRAEEAEMWDKGLASQYTTSFTETPAAGVSPAVPPSPPPPPSASVAAAAAVTGLTGAGTVLVQSATTLATSHTNVDSGMLALVGVLILAGVFVLAWAAWRTHRPKG